MPPKNPVNGFALFMYDQKDVLRRQGAQNLSGQSLASMCGPLWKALPEGVRKEYDRKAKEMKAKQKNAEGDMNRRDCMGNIVGLQKDAFEEVRKRRERERGLIVSKWTGKDLKRELFYLVNFQDMCELTDGDNTVEREWLPREVALLEYSLEQGIIKHWQKFINPGEIPKGYRYTCVQKAEQSHKIPVEDFNLDCDNYRLMWHEMKQLLKDGRHDGAYPPLYCLASEFQKTKYLMDWMWHCGDEGSADNNPMGRIYALEDLVAELIAHSGHSNVENISSSQITAKLDGFFWDYIPGTQCSWHEEQDTKFCALGYVRRYAYTVSDIVAPLFGITLTDHHVPSRTSVEPVSIVLPPDVVPVSNAWRQRKQGDLRGSSGQNRRPPVSQPSKLRPMSPPDADSEEEEDFTKHSANAVAMEKLRTPLVSNKMAGPQPSRPYGYQPPPAPPMAGQFDDWPELGGGGKSLLGTNQEQTNALTQKTASLSLRTTTDAGNMNSAWGSSRSSSVVPPPGFKPLSDFGVRPAGRGTPSPAVARGTVQASVGRGRVVPPVGRGTAPPPVGRGAAPTPLGRGMAPTDSW